MKKKPDGFYKIARKTASKRSIEDRIKDWNELLIPLSEGDLVDQAARCMDCGIPFCHGSGCPLSNYIPLWNELICNGEWQQALELMEETNPFPEVTGRVCPALCEAACTLSINKEPVTIQQIELAIVEKGFKEGWLEPKPPLNRTGKRVAIIGSGPAGLSAAKRLNALGHTVTVIEKADRIGGLLRYGIPDFKLEKNIIDRRIKQMKDEGVIFETEVNAGKDVSEKYLDKYFDAICLCCGAQEPRKLNVPGCDFEGIHPAMEYLEQQNRIVAGDEFPRSQQINAKDKVVVVLGGGDTGSDCVGTAIRQGAKEVYQFEILPKPPDDRTDDMPWPSYPRIHRISSSQEEGCIQRWNILTKSFGGQDIYVNKLNGVEIKWLEPDSNGKYTFEEIPGTEFEIQVDLVILALGFTGPRKTRLLEDLNVELDEKGNVKTDVKFQTTKEGVFCIGDMNRGPSLVVWAIEEGQQVAKYIHEYLMTE